ncbi:MAG: dTDP-4-dehydrorhamnose reductase [Sphingobacteriia bacterium]|jgi:dTDP-4-dehydrorhamnose reductase
MKPLVIVTGKNGQLGWELQQLAASLENQYHFIFTDRELFNLSNPSSIAPFFEQFQPNYFINCAAYTAVDKAESEKELALIINGTAVGEIAKCCEKQKCKLITISTDYVFNGKGNSPYKTDTTTDPVNYYGYTKSIGEKLAQQNNPSSIVIRTSWVYSEHGNNFVKTMLRLMKEKPDLKIVNDQIGCPTYAADLAKAIISILDEYQKGNQNHGIYHYSNTGIISWFDFAVAIKKLADHPTTLYPITTAEFPTPAKRPAYSVMDTSKIVKDFGIRLNDWEESLKAFFHKVYL